MPITPEDRARENIDKLLTDAGWIVQDKRSTNLSAGRGVAVREFPLKPGHGEADYLLFIDGAPIGVVEAKREGDTLTGVELRTAGGKWMHKSETLENLSGKKEARSVLDQRIRESQNRPAETVDFTVQHIWMPFGGRTWIASR
jgi:hypothetical protein